MVLQHSAWSCRPLPALPFQAFSCAALLKRINEQLQLQKRHLQAGIVSATQLLQFQSEWHCSRREGGEKLEPFA